MSTPKYIESLKIKHRDNSEENILGSKVALAEGTLMSVHGAIGDNSVTLSAGAEAGTVDPSLSAKLDAMIHGGSGVHNGIPYNFSGAPYYYSTIAGVSPVDGHMFLTAKQCDHWGLFEYGSHPTADGSGTPVKGKLELTDVCPPCVDCADYATLYDYMNAVKDKLNDKKDRIYEHTPYIPGSYEQNNILELTKQVSLYWNHMIHETAWRCSAIADGSEINAACMFTNHFNIDVPAGLELRAFFADMPILGEPQGHIIDHVVPDGWVENVDYTLTLEPSSSVNTIYSATWTADYSAKTLEIVSDYNTVPPTPSPTITPGDYIQVVLVNSTNPPPPCSTKAYKVLSGDASDFVIAVDDMPVAGDPTGTVNWAQVVKFILTTLTALSYSDVESVRLYLGAIAPGYAGDDAKTTVIFENNLTELGFTGFPTERKINTNNMVTIPVSI